MSDIETNKEIVRQFIDARIRVSSTRAAVDELVADDFESHAWPLATGRTPRRRSRTATARMGKALADIKFTIDDLIAEDDRVVGPRQASARQIGEFMGMPRQQPELRDRRDPHLPAARRQDRRALASRSTPWAS